ncbi:hypothetical protein E2562_015942, partial [Oryza meyeriana var. granulata]
YNRVDRNSTATGALRRSREHTVGELQEGCCDRETKARHWIWPPSFPKHVICKCSFTSCTWAFTPFAQVCLFMLFSSFS